MDLSLSRFAFSLWITSFCVAGRSRQFAFSLPSGAHGHALNEIGARICCPDLPRCIDSVLITFQADCRAKVDQLTVCHDSCESTDSRVVEIETSW